MSNFDTFKGFSILTELGKFAKFGRKIKANLPAQLEFQKKSQLCQNFGQNWALRNSS